MVSGRPIWCSPIVLEQPKPFLLERVRPPPADFVVLDQGFMESWVLLFFGGFTFVFCLARIYGLSMRREVEISNRFMCEQQN